MPQHSLSLPTLTQPLWQRQLTLAAWLGLACLVGIYSRPIGFLAAVWPANAILLGLLLRHKDLGVAPMTWLYALLGYLIPDLLTGASLALALGLNLANLLGVAAGWAWLVRQHEDVLHFRHQRAILAFFVGCLLASAAATVIGTPVGMLAFDLPLSHALVLWMSSDFYCYALILPLFLATPPGWVAQLHQTLRRRRPLDLLLPVVTLAVSEWASLHIGGPGSDAFVVPAMIWCAMAYGVLPTAVLSLLLCTVETAAMAMGALNFTSTQVMQAATFRTGLALLTIAPLAVACLYSLRQQTLEKLRHALRHDYLTNALTRQAFVEHADAVLARMHQDKEPYALLMLDVDHFKHVNDQHGHAQGDRVLQEFCREVQHTLRPWDVLGRLGGEEFAVLLPGTDAANALAVAQRLCDAVRQLPINKADGQPMHITVSIGLWSHPGTPVADALTHGLKQADLALYQAKAGGRDRVVALTV